MSYLALYRKFRPETFLDVRGQEGIVRTLTNQIMADRIGHAYLFCGTRGTGKTTVAKIFAKAVNCESPVEGNPCGHCAMCKEIGEGISMNVIEIDAASNNGIDNIREIREEVSYRPTKGRYKVYIIDEVHMLSQGAFNALLKTLEEPPEYVIFILATTEIHKIPITILSRCQRYDFRRISKETILKRLQELVEMEALDIEEEALSYIAKMGDGSMRDALSILDQCSGYYLGERLTYVQVLDILGAVDDQVFDFLLRGLVEMDVKKVMQGIEEVVMQGRELSQMTTDFSWFLRNLLLLRSGEEMAEVLEMAPERAKELRLAYQSMEEETLLHIIRVLSELSGQIKYSSQKRILLETAFLKLCRPEMEIQTDALLDRIRRLEERLQVVEKHPVSVVALQDTENKKVEPKPKLQRALPQEVEVVARGFRQMIEEVSPLLRTYLRQARLSVGEDNQLLLVMPDEISKEAVEQAERLSELQEVIQRHLAKEVPIQVRLQESQKKFEDVFVDIEAHICMELTIEE